MSETQQSWSWKKFFKTSFLSVIFISAIVGGFFLLYVIQFSFRIYNVEVVQKVNPVALNGMQGLKGDNLLFLSSEEVEKNIKLLNPSVDTITVTKVFPSSLRIEITNLEPIAQLTGDVGYFILAQNGKILSKQRDKTNKFPVITYYQKMQFVNHQSGSFLDFKDIIITLNFIKKVKSAGIPVETVDIAGFHMIRLLSKNKEILISADKDIELQNYQFDTIVREIRKEGNDFSVLDLRFDKPVFEPVEKEQ